MKNQNPNDRPADQTAVFNYDLVSFNPTPEEWALFQDFHPTIAYDLSGALVTELNPFFEETRSLIHCVTEREPVGGLPHPEDIAAGVKIFESWAGDQTPAQPLIVMIQQLRARDVLNALLEDEVNRLNAELEKLKTPLFAGPGPDLQEAEPKAKGPFTRDSNRKPVSK